jgi:uncharacterized protein YegP (UPF0339 family)
MKSTLRTLGLAILLAASLPAVATGCSTDTDTASDVQDHRERQGRFEIFEGRDGQRYFHLLAGNGEKVLRSEGYVSLSGAKNGVDSVKENALSADNFEILRAESGEHYFNLKAQNHQIIGTSEMYASYANAERAVETVVRIVTNSVSKQLESSPPKFESFDGSDGEKYFRLRAGNGEIVLQSEGYTRQAGADNGIESVKTNGVDPDKFTVLEAQNGQHYFTLKAGNGQVIATSELYASKYNAGRGAETVRRIVRELTDVVASDDQIRQEVEAAAEGLLYMSEADYPYTWVEAELDGDEEITEDLVREKMAVYVDNDPDADAPLAELYGDSGEFRASNAQACLDEEDEYYYDDCVKQAALDAVLTSNLTDIKIFHFGRYGAPGAVDARGQSGRRAHHRHLDVERDAAHHFITGNSTTAHENSTWANTLGARRSTRAARKPHTRPQPAAAATSIGLSPMISSRKCHTVGRWAAAYSAVVSSQPVRSPRARMSTRITQPRQMISSAAATAMTASPM